MDTLLFEIPKTHFGGDVLIPVPFLIYLYDERRLLQDLARDLPRGETRGGIIPYFHEIIFWKAKIFLPERAILAARLDEKAGKRYNPLRSNRCGTGHRTPFSRRFA